MFIRSFSRGAGGRGGRDRRGAISGRGGGGNRGGGRGKESPATKAAKKAALAAFLLNKYRYGTGGSKLAAAEEATSTVEEVVCEGEKTREERDAELRGEAVSLDE